MIHRAIKEFFALCCDVCLGTRWFGYHAARFAGYGCASVLTVLCLVGQVNPQVNGRDIERLNRQMEQVVAATGENQKALLSYGIRIDQNDQRMTASEAALKGIPQKTDLWLAVLILSVVFKVPLASVKGLFAVVGWPLLAILLKAKKVIG